MLYMEIVAICCETQTKTHKYTVWVEWRVLLTFCMEVLKMVSSKFIKYVVHCTLKF